jgi:hypothetical protein
MADSDTIPAPCGLGLSTVAEAIQHAATCPLCNSAVTVADKSGRPTRRSLTLRRERADDARRALAAYAVAVGTEGREAFAMRRLGWALAHLEVILWHQTGGAYGHQYSNSKSAMERQAKEITVAPLALHEALDLLWGAEPRASATAHVSDLMGTLDAQQALAARDVMRRLATFAGSEAALRVRMLRAGRQQRQAERETGGA